MGCTNNSNSGSSFICCLLSCRHPTIASSQSSGGFENRNWGKDVVHIRYEAQQSITDWDELFLYRKVSGIVGIADCSVEADLSTTFQLFQGMANRFRISSSTSIMQQGTIPRICLAFELRSDQKDPDLRSFQVIPDQDFEHFSFYIKHIFLEELIKNWLHQWESVVKQDSESVSEKIFDSLYNGTENVSNPSTSHTALVTPWDDDLPDEAPKARRRRLVGRVKKQQGDFCLFAGSPIDALHYYRQAIEIGRLCYDWEWVGSALESVTSATIAIRGGNFPFLISQLDYMDITSKLLEAWTCYSKRRKGSILEIECMLRLASFYQAHGKHLEMNDILGKCHDAIESGLEISHNLQTKIKLYSSVALIYRNASLNRKYSFYVQHICRICAMPSAEIPSVRSHQLLQQIAAEYDVNVNSLSEEPAPKPAYVSKRYDLIQRGPVWIKLQASLLSLLIDMATSYGDPVQTLRYLVYMVREVVPHLQRDNHLEPMLVPGRTDWSNKLKSISQHLPPPCDLDDKDPIRNGLGIIQSWKPQKDRSVYMHVSRSVTDPLFLYRPNRKAKAAIAASAGYVFGWSEHTIQYEISLRNPLHSKLIMEDARISFHPVVLTPLGESRYDVEWLPQMNLKSETPPSAQIIIEGLDTITVKLSVQIPTVDPMPKDKNCQVLLAPAYFHYSSFNIEFSEPMIPLFGAPVKVLLAQCIHYLHNVPTLTVEDSSHTWLTSTATYRDPETTLSSPLYFATVLNNSFPSQNSLTGGGLLGASPHFKGHSRAHSLTVKSLSSSSNIPSNIGSSSEEYIAPASEKELTINSSRPINAANSDGAHQLTIAISQLRGERFQTSLIIRNNSNHDVQDFGLTIYENGEALGPSKKNRILQDGWSMLSKTISENLPLKPGTTLIIPISFISPDIGLVQVSFLLEYRNNETAENMWRKLRMDYSFKVVEALVPLNAQLTVCSYNFLDALNTGNGYNCIALGGNEPDEYLLLQLAIQNKTMLTFHVLQEQPSLGDHELASKEPQTCAIDPWGTKYFYLAFHYKSFILELSKSMASAASSKSNTDHNNLQDSIKLFLSSYLKMTWRAYGNRTGVITIDQSTFNSILFGITRPKRYTVNWRITDIKGNDVKESKVSPGSHTGKRSEASANQVYRIISIVDCHQNPFHNSNDQLNQQEHPTQCTPKLSVVVYAQNVSSGQEQKFTFIGKNFNISVDHFESDRFEHISNIMFHHPGAYTILSQITESDQKGNSEMAWSNIQTVNVSR